MRWLVRSILILAALGLLWLGLVLSHWLPRPTAEERAALAAFEQPQAQVAGERNAAEFLRLFEYVLSPEELAEVSAIDQVSLAALARPEEAFQFHTHAEDRFDKLPQFDSAQWHCDAYRDGSVRNCLNVVRANEFAARELLASQAVRLQKEMALTGFDHVGTVMPAFATHVIGPRHPGMLVTIAAAIEHLDGRTEPALDRLCKYTLAWRQLLGRSNSLINHMIGAAAIIRVLRMASEIQAEAPELHPQACEEAFHPLSHRELSMCRVMRGEFEYLRFSIAATGLIEHDSWWEGLNVRMFNRGHTEARLALPMAWYCQDEHAERARLRSATPAPPQLQCSFWQKVTNPIGCILAEIASPGHDRYYLRTLDLDARLRLYQAARWIAQSDKDPAAALAELPAEMRSPEHQFSIDSDGRLRTSLLDRSRGEYWTLAPMGAARGP